MWKLIASTLFIAVLSGAGSVSAQIGVHATLDEVLTKAFSDAESEYKTLWLQNSVKERFEHDLGFEISGLRARYWQSKNRTLWILDEIGKEYPITFAYIIDSIPTSESHDSQISSAIIMEYRESRGGEIRHDFFRRQFNDIRLDGNQLNQKIDGITGATLSVWAMEKTAKTALWLHKEALSTSK